MRDQRSRLEAMYGVPIDYDMALGWVYGVRGHGGSLQRRPLPALPARPPSP